MAEGAKNFSGVVHGPKDAVLVGWRWSEDLLKVAGARSMRMVHDRSILQTLRKACDLQ